MKFLCLHGNGTNSNIMQLQTAPLRHELEDGHEYEFVEATLSTAMSQGVETLSSPDHSFYAFYNPQDLSTLQQAVAQLDAYVAAEGPFDGVVGFSAGAVLAALYMAGKQQQQQQGRLEEGEDPPPPFKCAVFLSSAESRAETSHLFGQLPSNDNAQRGYYPIQVPTAHIWGANDGTAPTGGQDLCQLCDPALRHALIHDGGHQVPRGGAHLTEAVHTIRRAVHQASR